MIAITRRVYFLFQIIFVAACYSKPSNQNIVLINVGDSDNGDISKQLEIINNLNPRVISIDIALSKSDDKSNDSKLYSALSNSKGLVMASAVEPLFEDKVAVVFMSDSYFLPLNPKTGFVNAQVEEGQVTIPSKFFVYHKVLNDATAYHFSIMTAMTFDSLKTDSFIKKNSNIVEVDFNRTNRKFKVFKASEVLNGVIKKDDIEGKIVMIGYLGPRDHDKFYSPLNKDMKKPDLYGLEYLALIVSQILGLD